MEKINSIEQHQNNALETLNYQIKKDIYHTLEAVGREFRLQEKLMYQKSIMNL